MDYSARNQKWGDSEIGTESGEITWSSNITSGLQYDTSRYDLDDFNNALQDAFDAWESVSGLDFTYIGTGDADIDVEMGYGDGARFGVVGWAYSNGGSTITSASIDFDEQEIWAPTGSGGINFYAVALHEIGHTFGLNHYDLNTQIMNSSISTNSLQSGDIAGAQYLYGTGGLVAPSDPPPTPPSDPDPDPVPAPPTPPSDPDPDPVPIDDGGSSGGAIGAVVALLGLVFGMVFGGGLGAVALAAGRSGNDATDDADDNADDAVEDVVLADLIPVIEDQKHAVWVDDEGNFIAAPDGHHHHGDGHNHGHGCDCGYCATSEVEEDFFFA